MPLTSEDPALCPRPAPHPEALTFHAIPQLLALLGLGRLTVGVLPVGLTRRGSRLAVLGGGGCPRLGAAAQRMGTVRGVGGLGGLGRRHLLRGRLVGHAFVHARDGGLWGKPALRAERALAPVFTVTPLSMQLSPHRPQSDPRCGLSYHSHPADRQGARALPRAACPRL